MVIDTSSVLAVLFNEPNGQWVAKQLDAHRGTLQMSTVNLAEAIIVLRSRMKEGAKSLEFSLLSRPIRFVPPTIEHAQMAAEARLKFPLNLGDCFVYALAAATSETILTLDEDFRKCNLPVLLP
jgi:ribonuclease VapC